MSMTIFSAATHNVFNSMLSDPAVVDFTETSGAIFVAGDETITELQVTLANLAPTAVGSDIRPVSDSDVNYHFTVYISDVDMSQSSDTLALTYSTQFPLTGLQKGVDAQYAITLTGSCTLTFPDAACSVASYICLLLSEGLGASYVDSVTGNNIHCLDISSRKSCHPGLAILCIFYQFFFNFTNECFYMHIAIPLAKQRIRME